MSLPRKSDIRPWWTEAVAEIQNAKETLFIANQHSSAVRLLITSHVEQLTVLFLCWENSTGRLQYFGIQLSSQNDSHSAHVKPEHQRNHGAQRSKGLVVVSKASEIPGRRRRNKHRQNRHQDQQRNGGLVELT
jgi:hypothetical protein